MDSTGEALRARVESVDRAEVLSSPEETTEQVLVHESRNSTYRLDDEDVSEPSSNQKNQKMWTDMPREARKSNNAKRVKIVTRRLTKQGVKSSTLRKLAEDQLQRPSQGKEARLDTPTTVLDTPDAQSEESRSLLQHCLESQWDKQRHERNNSDDFQTDEEQSVHLPGAGDREVETMQDLVVVQDTFASQLESLRNHGLLDESISALHCDVEFTAHWCLNQRAPGGDGAQHSMSNNDTEAADCVGQGPTKWDMPPSWPSRHYDSGARRGYNLPVEDWTFEDDKRCGSGPGNEHADQQARAQREHEAAMAIEETIKRNGEVGSDEDEGEDREEIELMMPEEWNGGHGTKANDGKKGDAATDNERTELEVAKTSPLKCKKQQERRASVVSEGEEGKGVDEWELVQT